MKFDQWGSPIQNIYIRKVEKVGGKLQNTVIHTYPNVSQFWTYKPEEFLRNPVYDRDKYPGCRFCEGRLRKIRLSVEKTSGVFTRSVD